MAQTDNAKELMYRNRNAYSRYFNTKYRRKGRLGEKHFFLLEIEGLHHTIAALNYVNRQGLHHGLAATPFDYPHCSANAFFQKQLGKKALTELPRLAFQNAVDQVRQKLEETAASRKKAKSDNATDEVSC